MNAPHPTILTDIKDLAPQWKQGAISIGNFDGVHLGHRTLIKELVRQAKEVGGPAIIFTFVPHPAKLLRPEAAPTPLTWIERRASLLMELGVDAVVAYPTDRALLSLSAQEFFRQVLVDSLAAKALVEGPNFYFGKNRGGDVKLLGELCGQYQIGFSIVAAQTESDGQLVSSSAIRKLIGEGDVAGAASFLARPYRLRGKVVSGEARGRTLGFPTANLAEIETLVPAAGVYAGRVCLEGTNYAAAINIGTNPTFSETVHKVEVHLIEFSGDLYNQALEVDFLARLRDIQPFDGPASLKKQLEHDVASAKAVARAK